MDSRKPTPRNQSIGKREVIQTRQYVTYADLLRLAMKNHCAGIQVEPVVRLCHPEKNF
jgi:hypothetical protein